MESLYRFELAKAADVVINDLFKLKVGETIVITADTESDKRVVDALAASAFAAGAKPMVVWLSTPPGPGRMVDGWLPSKSILGATLNADAWVELNRQYFLYSETHEKTMAGNPKMRFMGLPAMVVDVFVRLFARVEQRPVADFVTALAERTQKAKHIRMTSPNGQDVEFDNNPAWPVRGETGYADKPGTTMINGQIAWTPVLDSVNGVIVFDGSLVPQIGILEQPVKLHMKNGVLQSVDGGRQGAQWEAWLRSFNHPQMLRPAHVCYGFHPGARITGQVGEDERIWGCTQWGFGAIGSFLAPPDGVEAPSHTDGVTLNTSVYLDGVQITDCGKVIDPELAVLAEKCHK